MGKGGTKFDGDAIGHRGGGRDSCLTGKEARKAMDIFLKTGVHPALPPPGSDRRAEDLAKSELRGAYDDAGGLPARNAYRPHVFISVQLSPNKFGHLQIELFDDINPLAARAFRLLCSGTLDDGLTTGACYRGVPFHKVLTGQAVEGGIIDLSKYKGTEAFQKYENPGGSLSHVCGGIVSMALSGSTTQDIADALAANVKNEAEPVPFIADCGILSSAGLSDSAIAQLFEARQEANQEALKQSLERKSETPAQTTARLRLESAQRKDALRASLQEGLNEAQKRQKTVPGSTKRRTMMDSFDSDPSSDESSEPES